jgi:hypothetical protein
MAEKKGVLTMVGDVTGAQATLFRRGMGARSAAGARRSTRTARRASSSTTRRTKKATRGRRATRRLVKGSAAAKRRMAQLRAMRR